MKILTYILTLIALALPALPSLAQSTYESYTFTTLAGKNPDSHRGDLVAGGSGSADGTGSAARFYHPQGVAVDSAGNVYVADWGNMTIRKVTPAGEVTTLAGLAGSLGSADGTGNVARFSQPQGVAVDRAGHVYVADIGNRTLRQVTPAGVVTTLAGVADSVIAARTGRGASHGLVNLKA